MIPYSASKAGVICLTKALAKEVVEDGIRVNCVAPAVIGTTILDTLTDEQVAYMTERIPMKRVGKPEEVGAVIHFLASEASSFVTGQCYDVSGAGRPTKINVMPPRIPHFPPRRLQGGSREASLGVRCTCQGNQKPDHEWNRTPFGNAHLKVSDT